MSTNVSFAGAGTVTAKVYAYASTAFAMPAVDGGNPDLMVTNQSGATAYLSFATVAPAGPAGAEVPGCLAVPGGASVLLTGNAAVLALAVGNPLVIQPASSGPATSPPASLVANAAAAAGRSVGLGATLIVTRGTASAAPVWRT